MTSPSSSSPGPSHAHFQSWAVSQGVEINGVRVARIPGRGIGVVADRCIKAGEDIIRVPTQALLSITSIPASFRSTLRGAKTQSILAAYLAHVPSPPASSDAATITTTDDSNDPYKAWKATWPSPSDFHASLPAFWPAAVQNSNALPPAIRTRTDDAATGSLLAQQTHKQEQDWPMIFRALPSLSLDRYRYFWHVVNTRSFYYEDADADGPLPESTDDRIAMVPWADYCNHTADKEAACRVYFDREWYTVVSQKAYEIGEEIYVCYGSHSNDLLLTEYGFILEHNRWDSVPLDGFFLADPDTLSENTRARLKKAGYFENYRLDSTGVCHRTQVAVRAITMPPARWKRFVDGRDDQDDDAPAQRAADAYITTRILLVYFRQACRAIRDLREDRRAEATLPSPLPLMTEHARDVSLRRWTQIRALVTAAFQDGINEVTRAEMSEAFRAAEREVLGDSED